MQSQDILAFHYLITCLPIICVLVLKIKIIYNTDKRLTGTLNEHK